MILPITIEPNPILHKKGAELTSADLKSAKIQKLIDDMTETMYKSDGVGIAAPQVGASIMLCVIAKQFAGTKTDLTLVNPVWEKKSLLKTSDTEGCLSVPGVFGEVKRYKKIKVNALDRDGNKIEFLANNFFARIVQHEVDHLNGILFIEKAKNVHSDGRAL
ncbi:MAG: peptide deformylase [Candidatus Magasanikbacteria bacterium RIFOXYA2_FULL_44_8]|uniref:Peptide deformylase n=1 Tax=Candidatus Magasanikbacteria bacterium RIFOXYA2_FULL_44_8 TaxID=1798696 RepID=A0A1F6NLF8_9BACT|nr:MAG: peptide deformylase [Candidatus Magasanikbacteria bacterium RIFOXYA2_FULL_44_8]